MPTDRRIDYVELPASDLDAVRTFYSAAFGWTFTDYGPDYTAFHDGSMDGGFFRSELRSEQTQGAALIVLYADDLEQQLQTVVDNGGRIVKDIFHFPGGRRFHFADPHGNELAVWTEVSADTSADESDLNV